MQQTRPIGANKTLNWELTTAFTLAALCLTTLQVAQAQTDLVPKTPATAPNYYCTWAAQNYAFGQGTASLDTALLEGGSGSWKANQAFTQSQTFGPKGWAKTFFPKVRQDLYFLMDDGYYTGSQHSMELDTQKFPSFAGTPPERLTKLSQAIHKEGWRGLALWTRGTPSTPDQIEPLLQWSKVAGVKYWKIDGGDNDLSVQHLKQTVYPELTLEHVNGEGPFNGDWTKDGRFGTQSWDSHRLYVLRNTAVYRTYDVSTALSVPTTLDRVAQMFSGAQNHPEVTGLLNCEDEVYIAATLGCTMGVMRYPLTGLRPDGDIDLFFNGARQAKRRMDEVVRALHWQRIAEPYGAGQGYVKLDGSILTDDWQFQRGETWDSEVIGKLVKQGAPARVSRNLPLPTVTAEGGNPPFVIAGRFPNGAVSVCTLARTLKDRAWFLPPTDVTVDAGDAPGPFGVFGHYRSLTLRFSHALPAQARILAQDLAGHQATDITKRVHIAGNTVTFPSALIEKIGKQAGTAGDLSDPGLIIAIRRLRSTLGKSLAVGAFAQRAGLPQVAKKGVGSYSNVSNAAAAMTAMRIGWYYNWGVAPDGATPSVQFVPMIWSHKNVNDEELKAAKATGAGVLLGFNEPDNHGQGNMRVDEAIADWPKLMATGLRLGSPASQTGDDLKPNGWLAQFMDKAKARHLRVDFVCIHPYQANLDPTQATADLKREIEYVHTQYGLPVWVTEYGMVNWGDANANPDAATAARFAVESAAMMDRLPYVERYAWYSLIPNQGTLSLTNSDGSPNVIGEASQAAGGNKNPFFRRTGQHGT